MPISSLLSFDDGTLDFISSLNLRSSMDSSCLLLLLIPLIPIVFLLLLHFIVRPRAVKIPIKNRHVFVTGGSSGIGLAIARQAAVEGARVSILARSVPKLEEARETIRLATGVDPAIFSADVRDYDAVARAVEEAGPIDVLVCNQGVFLPHELETQDLADVRFMMDINVMGTFHLIKAALPGMKRRTKESGLAGSIAMVSSQAGQVGLYGYTAYSASKFALRGLGEALQHEVVSDNIRVSLVFPPDTETPGLVEENKLRPEVTHKTGSWNSPFKTSSPNTLVVYLLLFLILWLCFLFASCTLESVAHMVWMARCCHRYLQSPADSTVCCRARPHELALES